LPLEASLVALVGGDSDVILHLPVGPQLLVLLKMG
jgi:hypothetical protein